VAKTKEWKPRRVRSEDDRGGSSGYIQLDEGESFQGYALFEGDPSKDEPGYYEYLEHWVTSPKGHSVPCAGDSCPYCEDGDKPRDRAKSLWLVTRNEKKDELDPPELRIFNLNSILIKQITEMRGEGDKIKGKLFRVNRVDDRGNYVLTPKNESLKADAVKTALKDKDAPDFDKLVTSQLRKAMEGEKLSRELEDDDEDEDEKPKGAKAKGDKKDKKKKETEEWPDELDEETVTVVSVEEDGNYFTAKHDDYDGEKDIYTTKGIEFDFSDLEEDQEVTVSAEVDGDGDYILSGEPEVEDEEPEEGKKKDDEDDELPDAIEDEEFEVVSIDANESTIDMKNDDIEFTLYFLDQGPASEVDFDDYSEGDKVTISAEKDSSGDLVATEIPKKKKAKKDTAKKGDKKGGKAADKKKGGKKGGKKK